MMKGQFKMLDEVRSLERDSKRNTVKLSSILEHGGFNPWWGHFPLSKVLLCADVLSFSQNIKDGGDIFLFYILHPAYLIEHCPWMVTIRVYQYVVFSTTISCYFSNKLRRDIGNSVFRTMESPDKTKISTEINPP